MLYTDIAKGWGAEVGPRPETAIFLRHILGLGLLAAATALMLLPAAVAVLVVLGVVG